MVGTFRLRLRLDGTSEPIELLTGSRHQLELEPARTTLLQTLDLHFGNERVILLPGRDYAEGAGEAVPGIHVVAAAFRFALHNPKRLLVVGHADALGSDATNMTVSEDRATNVFTFLKGDAAAWGAHCQGHYAVDDVQNILIWIAELMDWPTLPGLVDNDMGPQTQGALNAFRHEFNAAFEASIPEDGPVSVQDWEAFFQLYDEGIDAFLGGGSPDARRAAVEPVGEGILVCGEHWPRDACVVDGYPSGSDRRVDILFFDEDEPELEAILSDDPPGASLYAEGRLTVETVELESMRFDSMDYEVWARVSSHWLNRPIAEQPYVLRGPSPYSVVVREGTTSAEGELRETHLPAGNYEVEVADAVVPVASHLLDHAPGGFSVPSDLQLYGHDDHERPLHRSDSMLSDEWEVPFHELATSPDEPDPRFEDGVLEDGEPDA